MIVYRIANTAHSDDLSGTGAKLFGGRWNSAGIPMLYCSEHISLSLLELLVHARGNHFSHNLDLVFIKIPDTIRPVTLGKLKTNWEKDSAYSQFIGDEFVRNNQNLYMKVPSAVVQLEHNYIINPLHEDFKKVKIANKNNFVPDERLLTIK